MEMILDRLDQKIKEMKELRRLEEIKTNKVRQEETDRKYRLLVSNMHEIAASLAYLHKALGFNPSEIISDKINPLYAKMEGIVKNGFAVEDIVEECQDEYKEILSLLTKEWRQFYKNLTGSTIGTLNIISNISKESAIQCKNDILKAENWPTENANKIFEDLRLALENADVLIKNLDMDQEIISFLGKMNSNRATVLDLDDKIISWIRKNNIESKIRLSFAIR